MTLQGWSDRRLRVKQSGKDSFTERRRMGRSFVGGIVRWGPRRGAASTRTNTWLATVLPEGPVVAVDPQHEGAVEGVLLPHLDPHAGPQAERVEEGDDLGVGRAGHGDGRPRRPARGRRAAA